MFKFLLEYKPSLHIKNRQNLTPLTLAAKLARKEAFLILYFYYDFKKIRESN